MIKYIYYFFNSLLARVTNQNLKIGSFSKLRNVTFGNYNTLYSHVSIFNSNLGDYVYIANNTKINNSKFGNFCSIGPNVQIGLGMHPTKLISTHPIFFSTKKQCQISFVNKDCFKELGENEIGNDVWIGANVIVLDNIKIGDGAIIAAGSVVTKDVEPYEIVGGIPAKLIKKRFSEKEIEKLLIFKWWNKDIDWIKEHSPLFNKPECFFKKINLI